MVKRNHLIKQIKFQLVDSSIKNFKERYDNTTTKCEEIEFYNSLDENKKQIFFKIAEQIKVDTVASFLSLLDGNFWMEGQSNDFLLTFENEPQIRINRDLTDDFLNLIESERE